MLLKSVSPYSALFKISSRPSDLVPAKRAYSDHQIDFGLLSKHTKKLKSWIKPKYSKEINSKSNQVFFNHFFLNVLDLKSSSLPIIPTIWAVTTLWWLISGSKHEQQVFFFNFSFQLVTLYVTSNMFALTLELFKTLTNFEVWNWRNFIFIKNGFSGPANFHIKFEYLEKHYLIISNSVIRIIFYSVLTNGSDWCVSVEFEYVQFCISSMYNSLLSKLEIWNYRGL